MRSEFVELTCEWCSGVFRYGYGEFIGHEVRGWTYIKSRGPSGLVLIEFHVCPTCTAALQELAKERRIERPG